MTLGLKVLARPEEQRCDVEHLRHRLGQVSLEQRLRPLDPGSVCVCPPHATLRGGHSAAGKSVTEDLRKENEIKIREKKLELLTSSIQPMWLCVRTVVMWIHSV